MGFIDYRDGRPIYEQIADYYKKMILTGVMQPDEAMPSVRKLAMEESTNPNTVQRAYVELEKQGYLYSVKGKGSFVKADRDQREQKKRELSQKLMDVLQEAEDFGISREELLEEADVKPEHAAV